MLKDVTFTVNAGERVGICGRTGSGKSTLALSASCLSSTPALPADLCFLPDSAFFRFLKADEGRIVIDGLDISTLALTTLRSRLTILPQEAQLFAGTIRDNMDPFGQYEDVEIWESLVAVRMASWSTPAASRVGSRAPSRAGSISRDIEGNVSEASGTLVEGGAVESEMSLVTSLDQSVAAGGKNWSAGQRQVCAFALSSPSRLAHDARCGPAPHDGARSRQAQEQLDPDPRRVDRQPGQFGSGTVIESRLNFHLSQDHETDSAIQATLRDSLGVSSLPAH